MLEIRDFSALEGQFHVNVQGGSVFQVIICHSKFLKGV